MRSIARYSARYAALYTLVMGEHVPLREAFRNVRLPGATKRSKYKPHQGKREMARRAKRAAKGGAA